jgi:hypothetical protein
MTYTFKLSRRIAANHLWRVAPALLVLFLAACGASTPTGVTPTPVAPVAPAAVPGWLTISLDTPNSDDGAVQLVVTGPSIEAAEVTAGLDGLASVASSQAWIVVTGAVGDGTIARIRVPDVTKASLYAVTVQAVAARGSYALGSTSGYRATAVR